MDFVVSTTDDQCDNDKRIERGEIPTRRRSARIAKRRKISMYESSDAERLIDALS